MEKREMLYEGKAKQVFLTDDPDVIVIHYKDDATAYNNVKKATIEAKGLLNNQISTIIFKYLVENGIPTHFIEQLNDRDQLCRRVTIFPLEVIVRNVIAGSIFRRERSRRTPSSTSATRRTNWAIRSSTTTMRWRSAWLPTRSSTRCSTSRAGSTCC